MIKSALIVSATMLFSMTALAGDGPKKTPAEMEQWCLGTKMGVKDLPNDPESQNARREYCKSVRQFSEQEWMRAYGRLP
ncbi:hypothetical protein SAMN06265338_1329 [Rhodoblastus acidophilus]|uniref:Uncharacterized protein n=1 Tax=Rhodoblastus acidophilus TaxID=1074 RepID=A0A212SEY0_RHOAC|nr:hypothetical protein [Rhodoblastus acidophilus]PPQ35161.1 hypothetical protein CKO16_21030 [Rhodoblastus acidophilus]RAI16906.1 hypothetical protein CH337_18950 [Rhodoblastus acidophilus]SNB84027.1 hypothetical protein SAMN06265338_1329 [Rhodoblastus acidophilus]